MGIRFYKRIKLGKHITLNLSKKGASLTAKTKGISLNSRGKISANIPGTGITFYKDLKNEKIEII